MLGADLPLLCRSEQQDVRRVEHLVRGRGRGGRGRGRVRARVRARVRVRVRVKG